MIVAFRRPWWNGEQLFPRSPEGVEVDDRYQDCLPPTAKILSAAEVKTKRKHAKKKAEAEAEAGPDTLSGLAKSMQDSEV
jgi:hypothetical protein